MKTLLTTLAVTLAGVTPALAANANAAKGSSILLILFLGFGALIVVFQFVPGLVLFATMLKGLFTAAPKKNLCRRTRRLQESIVKSLTLIKSQISSMKGSYQIRSGRC